MFQICSSGTSRKSNVPETLVRNVRVILPLASLRVKHTMVQVCCSGASRKSDVPETLVRNVTVFLPFWPRLGSLGAVLERLGAVLGRLGAVLEPSWDDLGTVLGPDGPFWGVSVLSGAVLDAAWGRLGAILGRSWDGLGS